MWPWKNTLTSLSQFTHEQNKNNISRHDRQNNGPLKIFPSMNMLPFKWDFADVIRNLEMERGFLSMKEKGRESE